MYAWICIFVPLYMDKKVTQTIKVSVKERKSVDEGFTQQDYIILGTTEKSRQLWGFRSSDFNLEHFITYITSSPKQHFP